MDLTTIWYPSEGYLGRCGVLIGHYNFGADAEGPAGSVTAQDARRAQ